MSWGILLAIAVGGGAIVSGLWALYFTESSRGRVVRHAALVAWTIVGLYAVGNARELMEQKPDASGSPATTPEIARAPSEKLRHIRDLPEMSGLSDDGIVLQLHAANPDLTIVWIAAELGVPLSPRLQSAIASEKR